MIGLGIALAVGYFWMTVCIGTMQLDRYSGHRNFQTEGEQFSSMWAGLFWPITILVWTAKAVARWKQ